MINNVFIRLLATLIIFSLQILPLEAADVVCDAVEKALVNGMNRAQAETRTRAEILAAKTVQTFKQKSPELKLTEGSNRRFIELMEKEKRGEAIYFDVENSLQKKMNDQVFQDKAIVDALNNNYLKRVKDLVDKDPFLKTRLSAEYKDYKGLRLRFVPQSEAEKTQLHSKLKELYGKANTEFADEVRKTDLKQLYATRSDEAQDPSLWFLGGTGEDALKANMAARYARQKRANGSGGFISYAEEAKSIAQDMRSIENARELLAKKPQLINSGILAKTAEGNFVLSKESIGILRKSRPTDFKTAEEYLLHLEKKFTKIFGQAPTKTELSLMSDYFNKVDALSPPLFQRERVLIDLNKANEGMVSVDFTGVGVDNAYEQMRGLAMNNFKETDALKFTSDAFSKMDGQVGTVTEEMNASKRYFSAKVKEIRPHDRAPQFSGDDGMFMPEASTFSLDEKKLLVEKLSQHNDPSKFRLTFVRATDDKGIKIPAKERSERVVRAEKLEKDIREDIVSHTGLSSEEAKKLMIAIDYSPKQKGGDFRLIVSPKPTPEILQLIHRSFSQRISKKEGERAIEIITNP